MAEIKMSPFTKAVRELDWSRELSMVHIHVERVIKFTILQNILPVQYCEASTCGDTTMANIVYVCCALVNLCPSIVPN